ALAGVELLDLGGVELVGRVGGVAHEDVLVGESRRRDQEREREDQAAHQNSPASWRFNAYGVSCSAYQSTAPAILATTCGSNDHLSPTVTPSKLPNSCDRSW